MNPILISKIACTTTKAANRSLMMGLAVIATAALAVATTSCATTEGFGKDVKKVGNKIENTAERAAN